MNPDSGELDEFENWSSETTECLVPIDRNGQILNHGQKWVEIGLSELITRSLEIIYTKI